MIYIVISGESNCWRSECNHRCHLHPITHDKQLTKKAMTKANGQHEFEHDLFIPQQTLHCTTRLCISFYKIGLVSICKYRTPADKIPNGLGRGGCTPGTWQGSIVQDEQYQRAQNGPPGTPSWRCYVITTTRAHSPRIKLDSDKI